MSNINNIVSVFEHFTDQLNPDKTNFKNPTTWDSISNSIERIFRIDKIFGLDLNIEQKQPLFTEYLSKEGGLCKIDEDIKGYRINDLVEVEFINFYPNIICRLYQEGILDSDIKFEPYYYFVKNSNKIKPLLSNDARIVFNLYKNYFFGWKLNNNDRAKVAGRGYQIIETFSKYNEWIYSDTCHFFLKDSIGLIDELKKELHYLELPYQINLIKEAVFFGRKKFFYIDESGKGTIKGFSSK